MASTLLLDRTTWDLVLDTSGDIAVAGAPYSLVQDAASAIKTFLGEVYYDTTLGVPYFSQIIGQAPPVALIRAKLIAAALSVPGVTAARVFISSIEDRIVAGQVQITDAAGAVTAAPF